MDPFGGTEFLKLTFPSASWSYRVSLALKLSTDRNSLPCLRLICSYKIQSASFGFRSSVIPYLVSCLVKLILAINCEISYVNSDLPVLDINVYRGMEIRRHPFLTSAIDGAEWSASYAGCVPPAESSSNTH
jgi:hypothetical protein